MPVVIRIELAADDVASEHITVSTALRIDTGDPRWPTWLVEYVTIQAEEGARRLREQLIAQQATGIEAPATRFIPLAAVVPAAQPGR